MKHLLLFAALALPSCANDPKPDTRPLTAKVMIEEDEHDNTRRFSRPVADVNIDDFRIWHGHDLANPKGTPTPDGLAASLGSMPDVLEVPAGSWDRAVVYTGFGQEGDGNRFVVAHTLHLSRKFDNEKSAIDFYRDISIQAADRFDDASYNPSVRDGASSLWRIDDPTIDWGWPRAEARIHRDGKRITANYQFFLQDRATSMRRVGKMRPLGRSTQSSLRPST